MRNIYTVPIYKNNKVVGLLHKILNNIDIVDMIQRQNHEFKNCIWSLRAEREVL